MLISLIEHWYLQVVRGILAICFGLLLIMSPIKTLGVVIFLFGLYIFIEAIITILVSIIRAGKMKDWGVTLGQGVFSMLIGAVLFVLPKISLGIMIFLFALWLLVMGISQIILAIRIRKEVVGEWFIIASGVFTLFISILLFTNPKVTVALASVLFGFVLIGWGIFVTAFGFELRGLKKTITKLSPGEIFMLSR